MCFVKRLVSLDGRVVRYERRTIFFRVSRGLPCHKDCWTIFPAFLYERCSFPTMVCPFLRCLAYCQGHPVILPPSCPFNKPRAMPATNSKPGSCILTKSIIWISDGISLFKAKNLIYTKFKIPTVTYSNERICILTKERSMSSMAAEREG